MFYFNLGHNWKIVSELEDVRGVIIIPSSNHSARISRGALDYQRVMIDPQLYLATLSVKECKTPCTRLSTYPWFMVPNIPQYDKEKFSNEREWQNEIKDLVVKNWPGKAPEGSDVTDACKECIDFQVDAGCTHIILPSPLMDNREDEADSSMLWLDESLKVVAESELTQPILASVVIDERAINDKAFEQSEYFDTVVDQYSSREEIDGVYLVIMQTRSIHPLESNKNVLRAYMHLSNAFSKAGMDIVITNYADVFGLVCMSVGATGFATGHSHTKRRMTWDDFRETKGGHSLPHLYSHQTIAEYLSDKDLSEIVKKALLRKVYDETPHSQTLMKRLREGGSAAHVPAWVESKGNISTAHKHFVCRMAKTEDKLSGITLVNEKRDYVRGWLEDAAANMLYIRTKIGGGWKPDHAASADLWLSLFDECICRQPKDE